MTDFTMLAEDGTPLIGDGFLDPNFVGDYLDQRMDFPPNLDEIFAFPPNDYLPQSLGGSDISGMTFPDEQQPFTEQPAVIQNDVAQDMISLSQNPVIHTTKSFSLIWDDLIQKFLSLEQDLKRCKTAVLKDFVGLENRLKAQRTTMDGFSASLEFLLETALLHPVELDAWFELTRECDLRKNQLSLFGRELDSVRAGKSSKEMKLVILNQPFPTSIKAQTEVEKLNIRVLVGAMSDIDVSQLKGTKVQAKVLTEAKDVKCVKGSGKLDESGTVVFSGLKLSCSNSKIVNLQVSVSPHEKCHVTTAPFVVSSNGNQWWFAERLLLEENLFGRQKTVSRNRFCNLLQRWYVLATGQQFDVNCKYLTGEDFDYFFATKFSSNSEITLSEFKNFWSWFGPMISEIRTQCKGKVKKMWLDGAIVGFMERAKAEQILINELEGTFLIRVSGEVHVKGFIGLVFSFRTVDHENNPIVKHYLVKDNDLRTNSKSIADFAREHDSLVTILLVHTDPATQKRILSRSGKHNALTRYYNCKYEIPETPPGYASYI